MKPQKHRSKWIREEDTFIVGCVSKNKTLNDIQEVISLRTDKAILKRANDLGYGYYTNHDDGLIYFKSSIKHKNRSCKEKNSPTKEAADNSCKNNTDIIPKKAITIADYKGSVKFILGSMKEYKCLLL